MSRRFLASPPFRILLVLTFLAFTTGAGVPAADPPAGDDRVPLLVRLSGDADRPALRTAIRSLGGTIRYEYRLQPDLVAVRDFPAGAMQRLERLPGVLKVMADRKVRGHLVESVPLINADAGSMTGYSDGAGVTVCVLDTGLNKSHPAFSGALVAEKDFVNNDNDASDDEGHGTHVAGTVLSRDHTYAGVAPGASLAVGKVLDDNGAGYDSDIIAGIEWATLDIGAQVINLSLGGAVWPGSCDFDPLAEEVNRSVDHGVVNVIASGNDGSLDSMTTPACASRGIAVGSVYDADIGPVTFPACSDPATGPDQIACYSNGSTALDVVAPGSLITSADLGDGFTSDHGTTLAAPHVTGLVARLLGEHPEYGPEDVRRFIARNAVDLEMPGFDDRTGHGRIDALMALSESPALTCTAGPDCEDFDVCTIDECRGGYCAHLPLCNDMDACTVDSCAGGFCDHFPVTVDDGVSCTDDSCDTCLGVLHIPTGACNSTCPLAIPIHVGQPVAGDTGDHTADYDGGCTGGQAMAGPDAVYRLDLEAFEHVRIRVDSPFDLGFYLLAEGQAGGDCDPARCFTGSDVVAGPGVELVRAFTPPYDGSYYLVVDSTAGPGGPFDLIVEPTCFGEEQGRPCNDHDVCTLEDTCQGGVCARPGPGQVPDGRNLEGIPLTVGKSVVEPGRLDLSWGASCGAGADDYAVYEGEIQAWYGHQIKECSTAGALSATIDPEGGNRYYLVVPLDPVNEGSYGRSSDGGLRPPAGAACRAAMLPEPCPRVD